MAAAYLLAFQDAAGKIRAEVTVLRGDPKLVAAVADGLTFTHRYTSGMAAWSPEDAPTQLQIERFVDEFEKTAWAGLDPDRYVWSVVLHRDDSGTVHVHIFAARCDLATGLSLNVAPPGWQRTFDPLRDAFNYECGWSRPDDPARARPTRPAPGRVHRDRTTRRAGEEAQPDPREEIGKHLLQLVDAGAVKDRAGVVAALKEWGYDVPRAGQHYVTARDPETGQRFRLKGTLYEHDFDGERFTREAGDREREDGGDAAARAAEAWEAVKKERQRRAKYNRAHYGLGSRASGDQVQDAGSDGSDAERESGSAAAPAAGRDASLAAYLQRELRDDAMVPTTDAAESTPDRKSGAGAGRGERGLAPAAVIAEAARAAGPDLLRALSEHVAIRERAVRATPIGDQWLADALLVEGEDLRLNVGNRAHAVETIEGRLESDLSRRESEVVATSLGPALLREVFGEHGAGDPQLDFAARDRGLEQVEQQVGEALTVQEDALRSIPFGRQCLSEEVQGRSRDVESVAGPLVEREWRVHGAAQRVAEELHRLEQEHVAKTGHEGLLVEATDTLVGGESRSLSLKEGWEVYERARHAFEEEERALDRKEEVVRQDPAGEALLRTARLEVLGTADREAVTLAERARVVEAAVALQAAAAEQERETREWEERRDTAVQALKRLPGGPDLYYAYLADRDPKWDRKRNDRSSRENIDASLAAAQSDTVRLGRLRDVLSNEVDAACYRETLEGAGEHFTIKDVDAAIEAVRRRREEDESRRRVAVGGLETTIRATKQGVARLAEAALQVLSGASRELTLEEREHVAQTVAGRIRADLEQRKEQIASTAAGAGFLEDALRDAGADTTLAVEERLVDAAQDRLGEYQQTRYEALSPAGRELYGAWVADVAPAGRRPGGPAGAVADRAYDATVSDERLPRLEAVYQDDEQRSYYRGVLGAAAGTPTLEQIDSALQATDAFEDRKNTVIEYPGSHQHPSGKELLAAALSPAGQTGTAASPAVLDAALSRVESQLEQRVQQAADEVEKRVRPPRPDPHGQPDHRVPAPSGEQLDEVVKPDDDAFYKATVAEVRIRYVRRALKNRYDDEARQISQEAYLEDKVATERSSSVRLSWGDALAIVLKKYLSQIREFFQVACDKALGGKQGERLAKHRAQVQQAADKAEAKLERRSYETGPAVPVVSDKSLAVVAGGASLPFVKEVIAEAGERYKRREIEGRYTHLARSQAERGYLHDAFEKRRRRSPSSAALLRSEVEAEVFAEHRRKVLEVFEVACDEVVGRGVLGARLEEHRAQVQRTADTVGQVMERRHVPTLSDETLADVRAAADSFLQEVVDVVWERYDRGTPDEELDDDARRRREAEEDYLAPRIEQELERQREARRASTWQAARERVIKSYRSWILRIFMTARDEVLGSGDGSGGAAGGGSAAGPPLERPSPPGQERQPPGGAQAPAAAPPSRGLGASERRSTGGGRAGRGENGPSGR